MTYIETHKTFPYFARRLACVLSTTNLQRWNLPTCPDIATEYGKQLIISFSDPLTSITPDMAIYAIDEWLTTEDKYTLTIKQRCILGCCLLELFVEMPHLDRISPSFLYAIHNIWPALSMMPNRGIIIIRRLIRYIQVKSKFLELDTDEYNIIAVTGMIIDGFARRMWSIDYKLLQKSWKELTQRLDKYDEYSVYMHVENVNLSKTIIECNGLDAEIRDLLLCNLSLDD